MATKIKKRIYRLKYHLEPGKFEKPKTLRPARYGLTDEILLCSYLQGEDGSGSYLWSSCNGKKHHEMKWSRQVHCMLFLVKNLAENAPEDCPNQKALLEQFAEIYRQIIVKAGEKNNGCFRSS